MNPQKLPLKKLIDLLDPKHARVAQAIYVDYDGLIDQIPGSHAKHQAWVGGYISHIEETMNIAIGLYEMLNARRKLEFSLSSVLFCCYLHDFDKLLRYAVQPNGTWKGKPADKMLYLNEMVDTLDNKYGYTLTDEEYNALKYAHGELEADRRPDKRVIWPLGTLVHCADIISARVWHDSGVSHDTWAD